MSKNTGLRRRLAAVAASTALLFGAGVATAQMSTAAGDGYACPAGYHCAFYETPFGGASHHYFNSDANFTNDYFDVRGPHEGWGLGLNVNDHVSGAENASTAGYESHYYRDINYGGGLAFCVNPGSMVTGSQMSADQKNVASSLLLRGTTTVHCF